MKFVVPMRKGVLICYEKSKLSTSKRRPTAILKIVFGYISVSYCPTNSKCGGWKQNRTYTQACDHNSKFRKLKMADGRHLKMVIYPLSQPRITRFRLSLVRRCVMGFREESSDEKSKISILLPFWQYLTVKIGFALYQHRMFWLTRNLVTGSTITRKIFHVTWLFFPFPFIYLFLSPPSVSCKHLTVDCLICCVIGNVLNGIWN